MTLALSNSAAAVLLLVAVILAGAGAIIAAGQKAYAIACVSAALFFIALVPCIERFQAS